MQQHLQVHKFGGTSVADAKGFTVLKSLLKGKNEIIVVSATKGTTSILQRMLDAAKQAGDILTDLTELEKSHNRLVNTLFPKNTRTDLIDFIKNDLGEIKDILHAVQLSGSYSKDFQDMILGYGEIWCAKILTAYLAENKNVLYLDASTILFIYEKHGIICIDWEKSQAALNAFLKNKVFDQLVITGFIAQTLEGRRTTLGRNGSDFSAAIFAKLFQAISLTIWTDVDGIYTADPARVPAAFVIKSLSYKEALELAYFGAKVLHPMTMAPLLETEIPMCVKNSFNPSAEGTQISAASEKSEFLIKALTSIDDIALINIEGAGMIGVSGIAARVFQVLQHANISVILISQASSEHSICFAVSNVYSDKAIQVLKENLQFEIEHKQIEGICVDKSCAILAVVGDGMVGAVGVSGKLCSTLAKANTNIRAISQGSSERNISVVIKSEDINKSMQAVHASFYLSPKTISIGIIGPGQVGGELLNQINQSLQNLKIKYDVNLCVRGLMTSKKMLLSSTPIELQTWESQLQASNTAVSFAEFVDHVKADDVPHAVIIDCTANPSMAKQYVELFERGIHVITPNKHANAGDLAYYKKMKAAAEKKNCYYLYEATVCAGLPVINTLQDLVKTGDEVFKIEGVVSGTLSLLFTELAKGLLFSDIVMSAKAQGFTETDPREDLSGKDVARKLLCLAREIGCDVSMQDIDITDLVPAALKSCSVTEFLEKLPAYDQELADKVEQAKARQEQLSYVGTVYANGKLHVGIESLPQDHPLSRLKGSDNMIIFHTRRYHALPLIIQGPGAGAEVTAAGILAELLRFVSFLS